jgi:flagellar basal body-associated protein FliL
MSATTTAPAPAAPEDGRRRRAPLLLGAVVLVLGVAVGAYLVLGGGEPAETVAEPQPAEEGAVVAVADMTANLAGEPVSYAKVAFAAVLAAGADEAAVAARFPLLRDAAITELSTITGAHLRTTAGADELRGRLTARAAALYPDGEVLRIVLTELVVQ